MNLRAKVRDALSEIKSMEGQYLEKVKSGSKLPIDHLELSYFSGLRNGFSFVFGIMENKNLTDSDFDDMLKEVLHLKEIAN